MIYYFIINYGVNMFSIKQLAAEHAFSSNTFLITSNGEAAVVDPSSPYREEYGRVKYVLLTHAHFDHMLDISSWAELGGATVVVSELDKPALSDSYKNCSSFFAMGSLIYDGEVKTVRDGDNLTLGDETVEILSVPGHTPGSLIYKLGDIAFVGDLAFAGGGFGRVDLPGGDYESLKSSIQRLFTLNHETLLLTGHGESIRLCDYKKQYRNF